MAGEESETEEERDQRRSVEAVLAKIRETWDTSEPDWASATEDLRFCGFEFAVDASGVKMHQQSYVTDLLDRHQIVKGGTLAGIGVPEEDRDPPSPKDVHKAQVVTGGCGFRHERGPTSRTP